MAIDIQIAVQIPEKAFAGYAAALKPPVVLKVIGMRLTEWMTTRFERDGAVPDFGAGGWVPLKPSTIAQRRQGSSRPLQDTGGLRQSYEAAPTTDGSSYVEVGSNKRYASFHERGTGPYTIVPKKARLLAARASAGGWIVFGTKVNHPGLPARPVLPTVEQAEILMTQEVEAMLEAEALRAGH